MTDSLVVATYNVHRFRGMDGKRDPARTAAVIAEIDADLIALQEAWYPGTGAHDESLLLDGLDGYECIVAPTTSSNGHVFANVLLSRLPVLDIERLDLSHRRREPRTALDVTLDAFGAELRAVATHLGLLHGERIRQIQRLLEHIERRPAPFLSVLGDFNDWLPGAPASRRLERKLGSAPRVRTFPALRPLFTLDRIWVHPGSALLELRAHRSPISRVASDHLPVVARVARPESD